MTPWFIRWVLYPLSHTSGLKLCFKLSCGVVVITTVIWVVVLRGGCHCFSFPHTPESGWAEGKRPRGRDDLGLKGKTGPSLQGSWEKDC